MDQFLGRADDIRRQLAAVRRQASQSAEADAGALLAPLDACLHAFAELRKQGRDLERRTAEATRDRGGADRNHAALVRDVLWSVTEGRLTLYDHADDLPNPEWLPDGLIDLDEPQAVRALRNLVHRASEIAAMSDERRDALTTAVGEAAANAVVHARGGTATVGADPAGTVQVRVTDRGGGIPLEHLPRVLLEMGYSLAGSGGFGLKIVLRAVDRVHLWTGPAGTTVLLEQYRTPPLPPWAAALGLTS